MKSVITPEIIVMGSIILASFMAVIFICGVARGIMIGRKEQSAKAERMAEHFAEWCDDHVSQTGSRSGLWYGGKLGITKHDALPTREVLKIFKRRFQNYG